MNDSTTLGHWFRPENILLLLFLAVLAWAPFPYGSNRDWAELLLALGLGGILFAWSGFALAGYAGVSSLSRQLWIPALCVAAALGWAALQSVNLDLVQTLSGLPARMAAHPVWDMTSKVLGHSVGAYVSVDPERTREAILAASLSVVSFLLAFHLARDRDRANVLVNGIIVITLGYAVMAVVVYQFKLDVQTWLMPDARVNLERLSGPFINPNHFATFLALGTLAALGTFVENVRQSVVWDRGTKVLVRSAMNAMLGANAFRLAAIVFMLSAILFTQSRAAVIALIVGIFALAVMLSRGKDLSDGEAAGRRAIVAILVAVLGISLALSANPLLNRVQETGLADSIRTSLASSTIKAIEAAPLTGLGFGAYERYYPAFADGTVAGDVDEAHNDVLETLSDLGVPAGLAYIAAPALLTWMCFAGCARRRRDRVYPAVGYAASVAVGLHSLADFGLQIPAVAVVYAALLGAGVAQSWRTNMDLVR